MTRIRSTPTSPFLLEHHTHASRKRQPTLKLPRYELAPRQKFERSRARLGALSAALFVLCCGVLAGILLASCSTTQQPQGPGPTRKVLPNVTQVIYAPDAGVRAGMRQLSPNRAHPNEFECGW